jgi:zinc protease
MKKKFFLLLSFAIFFLINYSIAGAGNMEYKTLCLKNGAKIKYLYRDSIPIVYVSVLIPASPLDEQKSSIAYLTARLLSHGTKTRNAREIEDEIDFLAISIEEKVTHDYTMLTLSTTKRHLKESIDLFFDIITNPVFPEDEMEKEISILEKSLKQMEEDPSFIAQKKFLNKLFGKHPYGRPVEGEPENLKEISRNDIVSFYKSFYKPDKMIFSVVGDIDEKELKDLIETSIYKLQGIQKERKISAPLFAIRNEPVKLSVKKDDLTQSTIVFGFEGISRKDPDFYSLSLMNYILGGGGLTSRLARHIREEKGLAYSIYSTFSPNLFPGDFYIEVKTKAENTQQVLEMIIEELKKMKENGVTDEELKEAKQFLIGSFPMRFDTMKKISEFLPLIDYYELGDNYITKYPEYIEKVTKEDIKRVAQKYLNTDSYILVVTGPAH